MSILWYTIGNVARFWGHPSSKLRRVSQLPQPTSKTDLLSNDISIFGKFNHPINNLPNVIEFLRIGDHFNQNIDLLPNSLVYLEIGDKFNNFYDYIMTSFGKADYFYRKYFKTSKDRIEADEKGDRNI